MTNNRVFLYVSVPQPFIFRCFKFDFGIIRVSLLIFLFFNFLILSSLAFFSFKQLSSKNKSRDYPCLFIRSNNHDHVRSCKDDVFFLALTVVLWDHIDHI